MRARRPDQRRASSAWSAKRCARCSPKAALAAWRRAAGQDRRVRRWLQQERVPLQQPLAVFDVAEDGIVIGVVGALRDYWARDMLRFGIPAHNGGRGPLPDIAGLLGHEAVRHDLPMSHGIDTRARAWQVRSTAQELFAEAVGARQTLFSTNGSSLSVHVAIMTVCGPGDTLVLARNGHKSAFAGLILSGARPGVCGPVLRRRARDRADAGGG